MAIKRYSIAEARDRLPGIVHEVEEGGPVELTRRGEPVAVVLSLADYQRQQAQPVDFADALAAFLASADRREFAVTEEEFPAPRDRSPGRDFSW